jgi:hypothetical protein
MYRISQRQISCMVFSLALLATLGVQAEDQKNAVLLPPAAPVPAQILSARKVFISNGGTQLITWLGGGPERPYNQLYASMKDWGRYELVSTPADADLVFEIRATFAVDNDIGSRAIAEGEVVLTILDPKTHITLWTWVKPDGRNDKDFNQAMGSLMIGVKQLVAPSQ